ncbi:hypothetical protein [Mycobacterium sp. 1245801.1]|uniref:hypothetical protein n=1 Tax=Mycobacterium sp. 1245801.1 TaxID=1834075 RepID=UPI0007FF3D00|nr:hypothetical protein [Mycobacterium sp. 1245801.1]OBJ26968.1 hypothetical protein A5622_07775 [Mycobacterium sp. 1245801.1]
MSATRSTYPYAAKVYRDYLDSCLDADVRVASNVPGDRPDRLVTIWTAPAGTTDKPRVFSWRRLIFQCWDVDEIAAGELCETVRSYVVDSIYHHLGVRKVKVVGEPSRFDDPGDSSPRFQTTIDVLLRAQFVTP